MSLYLSYLSNYLFIYLDFYVYFHAYLSIIYLCYKEVCVQDLLTRGRFSLFVEGWVEQFYIAKLSQFASTALVIDTF